MPLTSEKMAVDAPIPSARVMRMTSVNDGALAYDRTA
jgi:hypothetical protein